MALFDYTALTAGGERVRGAIAAASEQAVLAELESRRLTPVSLAPARERRVARRVSHRRLGEAYGQLADLLRAGVPLLRSLRLLSNSKASPALAAVFRGLTEEVEKGSDLAGAMGLRPEVFEPVHVAMVRAGEKGGFLEDVATRLAALVIKQAELRSKVVVNLIYPAILGLVGVLVAGGIFGFLVPKIRPMFDRLGDGLPGLTRAVFAISDALTRHGLVTGVVLGGLFAAAWAAMKRPRARRWWDDTRLRLPVLGPVLRSVAAARFCQLLGAMLSHGVPLLGALGIARDGTGSERLSEAVDAASEAVRAGKPLAVPLGESGLLDADVVEMIAVGEQANNLGDVLTRVGETLDARTDRVLGVAVRLIEPLLLVLIAGVVMFVAAGLVLGMLRLSTGIQ